VTQHNHQVRVGNDISSDSLAEAMTTVLYSMDAGRLGRFPSLRGHDGLLFDLTLKQNSAGTFYFLLISQKEAYALTIRATSPMFNLSEKGFLFFLFTTPSSLIKIKQILYKEQ
jgi:hypothetical protein